MRFDLHLFAVGLFNATIGRLVVQDTTLKSALRTCNILQESLGPEVVQLSGDPNFTTSSTAAWSLFNTISKPACVILPRNAFDVQSTMASIFRNKNRYAVQAGGHSAMTGWNSIQDGILITFANMKAVSYDPVKGTITLEPGVHWGEALSQLSPQGVAPLGGRFNDVGTGLLLGGGLSYLSGEYGFSADTYREVDVVLVSGELVTATATNQYQDLFRVLKGGANRFGIVTRYEVDAIPVGTNDDKNFFGGLIVYPNSSADALLHATEKYVRTISDPKASILMAFTATTNDTDITASHILTLFYHGNSLPEHIFGDFLSIPSLFSQLSAVSYLEVNSILGDGADRGYGQLFGGSAFKADVGIDAYRKAFADWNVLVETIRDSISGIVLAFTPIPDSAISVGKMRGSNIIDPPRGNYATLQVQTQFNAGITVQSPQVNAARQTFLARYELPYCIFTDND
ncbi:hypothetical protein CVT24_010740 [Panaeolus cyanescens]|uniref:FAD-binding PCMH-type domain-containing protein n=1 Tax=Panaeolus cyanescens TaxID=181874 RepID=A0A409YMD7_9AGAR|nr:hypothetical protein CVT24_010740 [Panaeolus cyanescens]